MSSNSEQRVATVRSPWPYLGLLFFTYMLTNFNANRLQPILPTVMETLKIDVAQAGILISAATFLNIFITAPIGFMITGIGLRKAGLLSMAFLFLGTLIGSTVTSYPAIITSMLLGGIGNVFIAVSGLVLVNLLFKKGHHATATSIFTTSSTAAQCLAFLVLPRITQVGNIKPAWRIDLVLSFVSFVLWLVFMNKTMISGLAEEQVPENSGKNDVDSQSYIKRTLANPAVWKLVSSIFLFMIAAMGVLGYLPSYLVSERGLDLKFASFLCSFNALVGFICAINAGILADRLRTNRWIFFVAIVVMAALRVLQVTVPTGPLLIMITVMQGIPAAGSSMVFSAITRAIPDPKEKSIGTAIVMTGFLCGMALSPLIFGWLVHTLGYDISYFIMVPVALLALPGIFSIKNVR